MPSALLRLEAYFAAVEKWADEQGAVSLEEGLGLKLHSEQLASVNLIQYKTAYLQLMVVMVLSP